MTTHSHILASWTPWTEGPGRLQSMGSQRAGHDWSDLACMHAARQKPKSSPLAKRRVHWLEKGNLLTQTSPRPVFAPSTPGSRSMNQHFISLITQTRHVHTFICVTTHFSNALSFLLAPFLARLSPLGAVRRWPAAPFLHRSRVRNSLPGSGESRTEGRRGAPVDSVTQASGLPTWN